MQLVLHCVSKAGLGNLMLTRSNLNQFANFFHLGNRIKFVEDVIYHFKPHLKYVAACEHTTSKTDANFKVNTVYNKTRVIGPTEADRHCEHMLNCYWYTHAAGVSHGECEIYNYLNFHIYAGVSE